jgi:hypothetical protein
MDGYYIMSGIGFVFVIGCLSIILDCTYDKENYITKSDNKKPKIKTIVKKQKNEDYDSLFSNSEDSIS